LRYEMIDDFLGFEDNDPEHVLVWNDTETKAQI
jgi:hypothetical protein